MFPVFMPAEGCRPLWELFDRNDYSEVRRSYWGRPAAELGRPADFETATPQ
jgi:hypothetical protein